MRTAGRAALPRPRALRGQLNINSNMPDIYIPLRVQLFDPWLTLEMTVEYSYKGCSEEGAMGLNPACCVFLQVPQRAEPQQQEAGGGQGGAPGSWGSWGPWSSCSRSCGGGVQEQTRPCLPSYTPFMGAAAYPSRPGGHHPQHPNQNPGHVVSALRPTVPLHRTNPGRPPPYNSSTSLASRRELRNQQRDREAQAQAGRRRGSDSPVIPGKYGYGRMPYVVSLQTDTGQTSGTGTETGTGRSHRQRRSPLSDPSPSATRHGGHRPNPYRPPYSNPHLHSYSPVHHQPPASQPRVNPNPNSNPNLAPQPRSNSNSNPPWSSSLYQPSQGHQPRQEQQHSPSRASAAQQPFGRPYNPLSTSSCVGEHNQYKICNTNACPPASRHIRAVQCSSYNSHPFMGRLYEWEPFNEVSEDHHCELNCRAIGFRFYVRQSDRVIDGTPCGQNETSICVEGRCQVGHLTHLPVAWPGPWTPPKPLRIEQNSDRMDGIRGKKI
ncbi:unnamed protein product [Coregonus sp. 'balchen']|nr:unnamed protein product [Coregonus sp. 'balchen']